jgi:cell division protein FtsQ
VGKQSQVKSVQSPLIGRRAVILFLVSVGFLAVFWIAPRCFIPLQRVQVRGPLHAVSPQEWRQVFEPFLRKNFLTFPARDLQKAIRRQLPWVDAMKIQRIWPAGVRVQYNERVVVGQWGNNLLLDRTGRVFFGRSQERLPHVTADPAQAGEVAAALVAVQPCMSRLGLRIQAMQVDGRGAWRINFVGGRVLQLGRRNINQKVSLFCKVYKHKDVVRAAASKTVYDFRYPNGFSLH